MALKKRRPPHAVPAKEQTIPSAPEKMLELGSPSGRFTSLRNHFRRQPVWITLAVGSGACAAINGVFAKLTTTSLTSSLASSLASLLNLSPSNGVVNFLLRAFFFGMNLLFNLAMWTLFTAALTRASSTTRVSIVNVSANFLVTALLGWMVFGEELKPLWFAGAVLLAGGNIVIGRREEGEKAGAPPSAAAASSLDEAREGLVDRSEREGLLDGNPKDSTDLVELDEDGAERRMKRGDDADAPL